MGVYINLGCFGTGFKSWFKRNLNSCRKKKEERKQEVVSVSFLAWDGD